MNFEDEKRDPNTENGGTDSKPDVLKTENGTEAEKPMNVGKEILDWVVAIAFAVIIALVVKNFVFTLVNVKGASMEPSLHDGDRLFVNRLFYTPEKGDVVIFEPEVEKEAISAAEGDRGILQSHKYYVKRVIATEGDTIYIDFKTGDVYVNNEKIDEPYIKEKTHNEGSYIRELEAKGLYSKDSPITVPMGYIFAMGDNRNNSKDSRELGPIPKDEIMGGAVFRFWPLSSIGGLHKDEALSLAN